MAENKKNRTIYLVDCENCANWLKKTETFETATKEIIMFKKDTKFEVPYSVIDKQIKVKHVKTINGQKDALDIQLGYYLGACRGNKNTKYVIVSNDKGYDSMIAYAQSNGVKVQRLGFHG